MSSLCRRFALCAALALLAFAEPARGLDPNHAVSQYLRTRWDSETGLPAKQVYAISQTPDGYLWIGTDNGLLRFDGFSFQPVQLLTGGPRSTAAVLAMVTDAGGNLWVVLPGLGVFREKNGGLQSVEANDASVLAHVTALLRESNGAILLADLITGVVRFADGKSEILATPGLLPGSAPVISMAETADGKVWMGTLGAGLFNFVQGRAIKIGEELADAKINCLLPFGDHDLWIGTDDGLFRWNGTELTAAALPPSLAHAQIFAMLRDRDSNVWAGTTSGLVRINSSGFALSAETELRASAGINAIFEDREGNIWLGGAGGLERIRDTAFVIYRPTGIPSGESNGPVYVDDSNRAWFAPADGGLHWLRNDREENIKLAGLDKDVAYSIAGAKGDLWVGRQRGGLTDLQYSDSGIREQTYTAANGLAQDSVYAVYASPDGEVWAGTLSGGVSKLKDGRFTTYTTTSGLASNTVNAILETRDGAMWFATPNGLSSFSNGRWKTYSMSGALPSEDVLCLFEDSSGRLWAGTSEGLASVSSGRLHIPANLPQVLREPVLGIAEDKNGWLWIATSNHVLRARRDTLAPGTPGPPDLREYSTEDGLRSVEGIKRNRSVVSDSLGRIWFSLGRGLSVVDPSHLTADSVPAIAHIESISVDGKTLKTGDPTQVPASPKRITFRYTGLSLAVPERVRFRYLLEGFDHAWSEPVANREAVYTNLGAGSYTFRLTACNSDGMWNGSETAIQFEIEPAFWQTWWFRVASVLMAGLAILALFRLRMLRMAKQMEMRFEERIAERTRIARELHDSLLQGFQGLMFRLQAVRNLLPERPHEAIRALDSALDNGDRVIAEGRGTVENLRHATGVTSDLIEALTALGQELAPGNQNGESPELRVWVEGKQRNLDPVIRDEIYRIAREALRNAVRHAQARRIEAELTYGDSRFLLRVRDDGNGIDPKVLDQGGRVGHWGLPGMRERATGFGGRLEVWSESGAGTEIELSIPAAIAYGTILERRRFRPGGRKS